MLLHTYHLLALCSVALLLAANGARPSVARVIKTASDRVDASLASLSFDRTLWNKMRVTTRAKLAKYHFNQPGSRTLQVMHPTNRVVWQCVIPPELDVVSYLSTSGDNEDSLPELEKYTSVDVNELLDILKTNCFYRTEGWWTYEFCVGKHMRQYHQAGNPPYKQDYYLGKSPTQLTNITALAEEFLKRRVEDPDVSLETRYFEESYVDGTVCDVSGKPRETVVRYYCDTGMSVIKSIEEPVSCVYRVNFKASTLCRHPLFQQTERTTSSIVCAPATDDLDDEATPEMKSTHEDDQQNLSLGGGDASGEDEFFLEQVVAATEADKALASHVFISEEEREERALGAAAAEVFLRKEEERRVAASKDGQTELGIAPGLTEFAEKFNLYAREIGRMMQERGLTEEDVNKASNRVLQRKLDEALKSPGEFGTMVFAEPDEVFAELFGEDWKGFEGLERLDNDDGDDEEETAEDIEEQQKFAEQFRAKQAAYVAEDDEEEE